MKSSARAGLALTAVALASWLAGCATAPQASLSNTSEIPPPPLLTTVSTRTQRPQEGPLAPLPSLDGQNAPVASAAAPGAGDVATSPQPAATRTLNPTGTAHADDGGATVDVRPLARSEILSAALPPAEPENGIDAAGRPTDILRPDQTPIDDSQARLDLWQRVRDSYRMPDLDGALVEQHERWYAARPEYVQRMTERGGRYLFHILDEVQRRGMPGELALLPFIESAFNPQAMSVAKASGMWQFIPSTGRDFDLKQNHFRDDRRDVLASTRAALDYLARLHRQFGDWHLALAAYNWGEGNVSRAIARNQRLGLATGYESLRMPAETRSYVPKLQAVKNIVANPRAFGLTLPALENHPYFMSVAIKRDIDVALAARLAGLGVDEFKALNPSMNKPVILAAGTPQVLLPYDNADAFVRRLEAHQGPLASWTAWVVPRTMRPADAARQVGVSESVLREVNHIPPRMLVKASSTLLVPRSLRRSVDVSEQVADNAYMSLAPDLPPMKKVAIKARKGDTVASVAKRHRISAAQLAQWNKVSTSARFAAGQSLVIYKANKPAKATKVRRAQAPAKAVRVASSRP
ncbi:Lytic transglycosylase catalytic [Leptothrix cholodnii SP-6]|uniref:Lytic transglycosylase catalytic n=1 Tax=Leptothrix cholodnii (strain ATCC 51168 / LMG 8142 / SP-6) TaxID=395495 RepID=B1Y1E1_LEPCP|nr:transglycosylase SLT domain-containing protein [Leptothrix cholodnii]ACB34240.1 Lytic transglycosylase catalytic [Leptothrix cholodnii SP-6]